jgi:eukaryotic-like serine/threonine-protein kinase
MWTTDFDRDAEQTVSDYGDTLHQTVRTTIVPERARARQSVLAIADQLVGMGAHRAIDRIKPGRILGEGGRGVVRQARQVALGRNVAIKCLRPEQRSPITTSELLQEAWVTGSLEHPNVVPVHDVVLDETGSPVIVLKRIDGVTWTRLMHDAEAVRERFGAPDLFEWNLGILMQVINAVRFAHSRGIVHRDIKPDNVMIGEFGEVYVLDWGIAVSLVDDGSGRLPLARHANEVAGTPCYMAPEMLGDDQPRITERTDVYLLGATLYELLTGRPPHEGSTVAEILAQVAISQIHIPPELPAGLARICQRAMAPDPEHRFASADELRRALLEFSRHRGSTRLARQAQVHAEQMLGLLDATHAGAMDNRQLLYNLYGACRFGFLEALSTWSDNEDARQGFEQVTLAMIEYELAHDDPRSAAALMADLGSVTEVPPKLYQRVQKALEHKEVERRRVAELERLGRQLDIQVGSRSRLYATIAVGIPWTLGPLAAGLLRDVSERYPDNLRMAGWSLLAVLAFLLVLLVTRASLRESAINRRLALAVGLMMTGQAVLHLGSEVAGFPPVAAQTFQMLLWCCVITLLTVTIEVRLFPAALGYLISFFVVARFPDQRFVAMAAANLITFATIIVIWAPRRGPTDAGDSMLDTVELKDR